MITIELMYRVFEQNGDFCKGEQWSYMACGQRVTLMEDVIKVMGDLSHDNESYLGSLTEFYGECLERGINPVRQMHFSKLIEFAIEWFTDGMEGAMFDIAQAMDDNQIPHEAL